MTDRELVDYYSRRAAEYESSYRRPDPERQAEQAELASAIRDALSGREVLEVACGTGYWTAFAATTATRITATDASAAMLAIARTRPLPPTVTFGEADAYDLQAAPGRFDAGLACCWLSHVPRTRAAEFLAGLRDRLLPGAPVVLADNVYVPGVGGELVWPPASADSYKRRQLASGDEQLILKNYYSEAELRDLLATLGSVESLRIGACFWWATCRTPAGARASAGTRGHLG